MREHISYAIRSVPSSTSTVPHGTKPSFSSAVVAVGVDAKVVRPRLAEFDDASHKAALPRGSHAVDDAVLRVVRQPFAVDGAVGGLFAYEKDEGAQKLVSVLNKVHPRLFDIF